jgi:cysteine-rich repeat protein
MTITLRAVAVFIVGALSACSFIDDFDRFHVDGDDDAGGELDAEVVDADGADDDARVEEDGGVLGEDGSTPELDASGEGDAAVAPGDLACRGKPDGTSCGEGQLICRRGFCRTSRCGDGFVDMARAEECDDSNLVAGDGCEPGSCQFSCESNTDCDNEYNCDGQEACEIGSHTCARDLNPATGLDCMRAGRAGLCDDKGYCVTTGCGDGTVGPGESCDPGQSPVPAGCRPDCTTGCTNDMGCADGNACNGVETCVLATATCKAGTKLTCADDDPCTRDGVCAPSSGCSFPLIDADGDQVSEQTCSAGSSLRGGDCDGRNAAIYPGATEYCDGADNDCDGMRDEDAVMATCYPDADGDGFPARQGATMRCTCGAGTRLARADGLWDCADDERRGGADVYPTQDAYFSVGYEVTCANGGGTCVSFDYNCDTAESGQYPAGTAICGVLGLTCSGGGYNGAPPACGQQAAYLVCQGGGLLSCREGTEQRRQLCR